MNRLARFILIIFLFSTLYFISKIKPHETNSLDTCFSYIASPFLWLHNKIMYPIRSSIDLVNTYTELKKECQEYREKYENVMQEYIALESTTQTWKEIEHLVAFNKRYGYENECLAHVLVKHFAPDKHFIIVDAGTNKNIEPNMVAVYKNCIIGKVLEVFPSYSYIALVTDPACKISAICTNSGHRGIHEGTANIHETRLTYVFDTNFDFEKKYTPQDLVISTGEGLIFPKGFALGKAIRYKKEDLHCTIYVKPLIDIRSIDYCTIIAKAMDYHEPKIEKTSEKRAAKENVKKIVNDIIKKEEIAQPNIPKNQNNSLESTVPTINTPDNNAEQKSTETEASIIEPAQQIEAVIIDNNAKSIQEEARESCNQDPATIINE